MASTQKSGPKGQGLKPGNTPNKLTPESKREEFRRYLEKAGVMDALTRVLVGLYEEPEKPNNAIEYFLERMSAGAPLKSELETIHGEMSDLQRKITELEDENERLRRRLEQAENQNEETDDGGPPEAGLEYNNI